ncbi:hypothetical protein Q7P37_004394 [Cladosporium fusiforme]
MNTAMHVQTLESAISSLPKQTTSFCYVSARHAHTNTSHRRSMHSSPHNDQSAAYPNFKSPAATASAASGVSKAEASTLAFLPLTQILRSYMITAVSSSPRLLDASSAVLRRMLESKSFLFSLEKNPLARALLYQTFYKQFCAGSTPAQVSATSKQLREQGYGGVILEFAREVLKDVESNEVEDVEKWQEGMLASVSIAQAGDFIGLKWSGMGPAALRLCGAEKEPTEAMDKAMKLVCEKAAEKNVCLLPSAEENWNLPGYHAWTLNLQRIFNRDGQTVLYNTYQCYLKSAPATLSRHLDIAREEGFTLGAKLVRGAYLYSEERSLIHDTIEDTHASYDGMMSALVHRQYNSVVEPTSPEAASKTWPDSRVVIASHNANTVDLAQRLRQEQLDRGEHLTPLVYAQLQGMADEVSCSLLAATRRNGGDETKVKEQVVKCIAWGSMTECLNYLLRRAAENKDAASRTADTRKAMGSEIWRRMRATFGLA